MNTKTLSFDQCLEIRNLYKIAKTQHEIGMLYLRELESEQLLTLEIFTELADRDDHYLETMEYLETRYNVSL